MDQKLPGIQIARAIAALSVMYFHSWGALERFPKGTAHPLPVLSTYGWIGVDLFFAISGFVICLVISKPGFDPRSFLIKRAWRIYPLWLLCLISFAVLSRLWRGPTETETFGYFLWSASLLPTHEFPYYDIGWSLQHEVAFYILAALIVPWLGIFGLVSALALSAIGYLTINLPWPLAAMAMYHGEFIAGIMAFFLAPRLKRFGALLPMVLGAGLLAYLLTGYFGRPAFPVALFFMIVGFANIRSNNVLIGIGEELGNASYSIYLLHPLVFISTRALTALIAFPFWCEEPIRWICITLTIGLSVCCCRFFERPAIDLGKRLTGRAPQLA